MERRDWSLRALNELLYLSLEKENNDLRIELLQRWLDTYLGLGQKIQDFELETNELEQLSELFYNNIEFMQKRKSETKQELDKITKLKKFIEIS